MKRISQKHLILGTATAIFALSYIAYIPHNFFNKTSALPNAPSFPTPTVPKEVTRLIDTVNKQTSLPENETPSVATVTDTGMLPHEPFFAKAQYGDKVLIYTAAKKAYLYRPSTGRIIQESAVDIVSPDASESAQASGSAAANASSPVLRVKF